MFAAVRRILLGAVVCSFALTAWSADAAAVPANAAKLNNLGVAYMNQQLMAKAVEQFDAAIKADPALATAQLNRGIALLNLQKLARGAAGARSRRREGAEQSAGVVQPGAAASLGRQDAGRPRRLPARGEDRSQRSRRALFSRHVLHAASAVRQGDCRISGSPHAESSSCLRRVWTGASLPAVGEC